MAVVASKPSSSCVIEGKIHWVAGTAVGLGEMGTVVELLEFAGVGASEGLLDSSEVASVSETSSSSSKVMSCKKILSPVGPGRAMVGWGVWMISVGEGEGDGVTFNAAVGATVTDRSSTGAFLVGKAVGDTVGRVVGLTVGDNVGRVVGLTVGDDVGAFVGVVVGWTVGLLVGGLVDGFLVGIVGKAPVLKDHEAAATGGKVARTGAKVGADDGSNVGKLLG